MEINKIMKQQSIILAIVIFLASAAIVWAAQKTLTTYTWDRDIQVSASPSDPPFGGGGAGPGFPPVVNDPPNPAITVDPETGVISLGNNINRGSGAIWYGGTTAGCNPCNSGVCTFGVGFRAYFEFRFTTADSSTNSTTYGDGFNFIIANSSNNDITKRGGSPNSSVDMGELIGYAGSGNTSPTSSEPRATPPLDGLGIEPPKIGIEFDTYPNTGAMTYNGCSGGRQDNGSNNHVSLMFWGTNPGSGTMCNAASTAGNAFPQASFDDNIHRIGDGTTSNPYNSAESGNGSGLGGYYERARSTYNWLEDNQWHRARIEVIRTPSSATYQVKAWIDCETYNSPYTACPTGELVYFQNVLNPYDNSSYLPKINRTQQLDGTLNTMFNNIIFGFTVATGGATQNILINNFAIHFPTISINPTSRSHTYSSASGQTISVTAAAGSCGWTAVSNDDWITITGGASGTGNGTVTYSITANTGAARTGTITIGGQTFTVTQAEAPCPTLSITTPSPDNGVINQYYSTTVSASGGSGALTYYITAGTLPNGLTLNPSTGVISGTPTVAGIWNNIRVTVTDTCWSGGQTAQTGNFSIRIRYNPYRVYAGTTMYYQSGGCQTLSSGSYYNLYYDDSVTFYRYAGCTGSTRTVTYSEAATTDADNDGMITVNRSGNTWRLADR